MMTGHSWSFRIGTRFPEASKAYVVKGEWRNG